MKKRTTCCSFLAALGLASLSVYILACASFSPDGSKVAFPAFDPQTGALGVGVYDRETRRTEQVFSLSAVTRLAQPECEACLLRPQWLDNKRLVVAWPVATDRDDKGLNVTTLPIGGKGAVRTWIIGEAGKAAEQLQSPMALAGTRLLMATASNLVLRLDLETGQVQSHLCRGDSLVLYPAGRADYVFYRADEASQSKQVDFGKLDARTFQQTRLFQLKSDDTERDALVAFGRDGLDLALLQKEGGTNAIRLLQSGQAQRILSLTNELEDSSFGSICLSPKGDVAFVSCTGRRKDDTESSLGFLEVPLDGRPSPPATLLQRLTKSDKDAVIYLQLGLSHDGKALALSTTYLCGEGEKSIVNPADCALYIVDVSKQPHGITKVPLPVPATTDSMK
jgi:hypothetical protein